MSGCGARAIGLLLATLGLAVAERLLAADTQPPEVVRAEKHWAFQKLARPPVPALRNAGRVRTNVDHFILAKLEAKGLTLSPDADKRTLIRRAYFDLIGLPPAPDEVEAFLLDTWPDAYERLVDRLLASPHFGERWGRHWLDAAGYADVMGMDNDATIISLAENKWKYRDYVIRSFNADKPFSRFVTEQLAGDELVDWRSAKTFTPEIQELLVATGFLRGSFDDTDSYELNTPDIKNSILQRTGEILANNLLALTLNCAKCHDHKYEPLTQGDYYRMLSFIQPAFNPDRWLPPKQRQLPDVSPAEKAAIEKHNAEIDRQVAELRKRQADIRKPYEERLMAAKLATIPEQIRADTKAAVLTPEKQRNEIQKYLASKFEAAVKVKPEELSGALSEKERKEIAAAERPIADLNGRKKSWTYLQAVYDAGPPTPTHILRRGNYLRPGAEVKPGFIQVLLEQDKDANRAARPWRPAGTTSGRRLALAHWLTDTESPAGALVLRVRLNRIWQHLFGKGIVESSDNFGLAGMKPTHPELLDWLATEFVANSQRLKPLLKLLMTSTVYRQASAQSKIEDQKSKIESVDPDNRLLSRMPLRRLESEVVRDAMLAVSGKLDRTASGPPVPVEPKPDGTFVVPDKGLPTPTSQWRRSVYLLARRNYHPTMLNVFDQPNLATNCTHRSPSAVVLQSLTMLNDRFVLEQADALAQRVTKAAGAAPEDRIACAFQIALARPPKPQETAWSAELLRRHMAHYQSEKLSAEAASQKALDHLCHMLLNTSEFLYAP